jgi:hypothetical protein
LRGCLVALLSLVGLLALVVFVGRASFRKVGDRHLAEVTARLDADDPGWRFEAIEAARAKAAPPDEVNPARVAAGVARRLPDGWDRPLTDAGIGPAWNTLPGFWGFVRLAEALALAGDAPAAARGELLRPEVAGQPGGYFLIEHQDNPLATLLPDIQKTRGVFTVLEADARMAALSGDPDRAVRDARAILVAARAVGDEPFLISQLVRMAGANVACRAALQVLAWGEPADGLAELQAELLAEAAHPGYLLALRGERAMMDRLFAGLEAGKLGVKDLMMFDPGRRVPEPLQEGAFLLYKGFLPGDRAEMLRVYTEYAAAAALPLPDQAAAIAAVRLPPRPPESYRYLITGLILPAVNRVHDAYLRTRTDLRAAAVAIACERFRRENGWWPESLAEIPKDILPELPTDPVTGGPLGYKRTDDGVAVFGAYTQDEKSRPRVSERDDPLDGIGRGWRLWDPKARGVMAPLPKTMDELLREQQADPPMNAPGEGDEP